MPTGAFFITAPPSPSPALADTDPAAGNARVLLAIPAVYFLFVGGEFAAMTYMTLTLTERGASALSVGALASALWLGIFASSTQAHHLVARHGHARVFVAATVLAFAALLTLPWHTAYAGWLCAAAVLGLGGGCVWVAGEAWLAEAAPKARRGLYVGLFETSVGLGLMAGPAVVRASIELGWSPLWVSAALMGLALASALPLLRARLPGQSDDLPAGHGLSAADPQAWRVVAVPLAAVAVASGLMESGVSSLLPSISMRLGFDMATAALLGTVIGAGSALLQGPFGWLADRAGLSRAMALAWTVVIATLALLLAGSRAPLDLLWGVGFVLAGVGGAVYTLVVIELGHRLSGAGLVRAMGLLVTAYTVGTTAGPALGGWLFDRTGLPGLSGALLVIGGIGAALTRRALRGPPR